MLLRLVAVDLVGAFGCGRTRCSLVGGDVGEFVAGFLDGVGEQSGVEVLSWERGDGCSAGGVVNFGVGDSRLALEDLLDSGNT